MEAYTKSLPGCKSGARCVMTWEGFDFERFELPADGILTIRTSRDTTRYLVTEIPTRGEPGRGFTMRKADGEQYTAFVADDERSHSCECVGFLRHGHCKHVAAARELIASGELPHPLAGEPEQLSDLPQ